EERLQLPDHVEAIRIVAIQEDHAVLRHDVEEPAETELDLVEVIEDVGVIELDVIHDQQFREVMDELRALVEESGIVFVALEHDAFALEKGGHGRINVFIRAGDDEATLAQRRRDRSHRGAADAEEMEIAWRFCHADSFTTRASIWLLTKLERGARDDRFDEEP